MKIALFDPYVGKFTTDMENWWISKGNDVMRSTYYNPEIALWADLLWFDTADNNLASGTNPGAALLADDANFRPWDLHDIPKKRIIVRPIDIEVWQGHWSASKWDLVDDCIFIAPHIRNLVDPETLPDHNPDMKIHTIPCGINLDRYHYADRSPGFNIAVVSERWISKGTDYILQIALKLKAIDPRYKITWLGRWSETQWEQAYMTEFVEHHDLPIEFINYLDGDDAVDKFLEDKNYLLHASHKEAFSYAVAEAMAKGIKPVLHRFYGADALWPGMTWDSIDQAIEELTNDKYDSASYRQYLIDHEFTIPQMMDKISKIIGD